MKTSNTEKPNYRKHCFVFAILSAIALLAVALIVIVVDPFFQYHKPLNRLYYLIDNKISQNPGIARNFEYDSVILGSSMTINFDTNLFDEMMGINTVKLSYDGAFPKDVDTILTIAKESPNEIKNVFFNVDIYNYKAEPGITAYPIPEYLYDENRLNDVPYLFNKEVLLDYILRPQIEREGTPLNEAYWSWIYMYYGKEVIAETYSAPTTFLDTQPANMHEENIAANLEQHILPHIESMPDTEFTIFFPPYSVLYWYDRYADGTLEAELQAEKQVIEALLVYPNVKIFYFQNQYDYITDLNNYSDYTHYRHEMNDYMTTCFADGTWRVTQENYEEILSQMYEWLQECEFENYLP